MTIFIKKSVADGSVCPPASKSILHRALICNALSGGSIVGDNGCDDVAATRRCLSFCSFDDRGLIASDILDCGESAATLRLLMPLLMNGLSATFTGNGRLLCRPMDVYQKICAQNGVDYVNKDGRITINGYLQPGEYIIDGSISSQFVSGLMLALPLKDGDSVIRFSSPLVSRSYALMTAEVMSNYGVNVNVFDDKITIKGGQYYNACDYICECDESAAAYIGAFGFIGGNVKILGRQTHSLQGDAVWDNMYFTLCKQKPAVDITDIPDLAPIVMALAAVNNGVKLTGTRRLRYKESDRISAMQTELAKVVPDLVFEVSDDCIDISPSSNKLNNNVSIDSHGDHRIAMAMALLLSLCGGSIDGAECVCKSYPQYFEHLKSIGIEVYAL